MTSYKPIQKYLHWCIAVLLLAQFIFHDAISEAWHAIEDGFYLEPSFLVLSHVFGGLLILALVVWRLIARYKHGAPPLPEDEPLHLKWAAKITHFALYALIILLPLTGAAAWFGGIYQAAEVHEILKMALIVTFLAHLGGFVYQQFIAKTGIWKRMWF